MVVGSRPTIYQRRWLEVNKCAFTFSSEIRQIQCTHTEFWCIQCLRPAGPSALDKHQIQASALDLSYFTSKSKCKFINLIHTRQKHKIICLCLWKILNKMALKMPLNMKKIKKWISRCDVRTRDLAPKTPRAVWAQSGRSLGAVRGVQWTLSIHSAYSVLPTPRFTRPIGLLWNPLSGVKKLLGEWPKIGLLFIRLPAQLFFLQICQFPVNSESFWASSMPKNILFINFRD